MKGTGTTTRGVTGLPPNLLREWGLRVQNDEGKWRNQVPDVESVSVLGLKSM